MPPIPATTVPRTDTALIHIRPDSAADPDLPSRAFRIVKGHQEVRVGGRVISWLAATRNGSGTKIVTW
jgi:hypothetical protein